MPCLTTGRLVSGESAETFTRPKRALSKAGHYGCRADARLLPGRLLEVLIAAGCGPARGGLVLAGDEGLLVAGAVGVQAASGAVPGGGAGDGVNDGEPALVERGGAGDLFGGAPGTVAGTDDEGLVWPELSV